MSTRLTADDQDTQQWLDRFCGIKSETHFLGGTGRKRYILWNEIEPGPDSTEWIKLDHSLIERVRR